MRFAKPEARASRWGNPDGTQTPIVRILDGGNRVLAVTYEDLPDLIAELQRIHTEHENTALIENLFQK